VSLPSGAAGESCLTCLKTGPAPIQEHTLVDTLLSVGDQFDKQAATRFSGLPAVREATRRLTEARLQATEVAAETGLERDLHAGLKHACEAEVARQNGTKDSEEGWSWSWDWGGQKAADTEEAVSSCVSKTRGLYALEKLSTQFVEQPSIGLNTVHEGPPLGALLKLRREQQITSKPRPEVQSPGAQLIALHTNNKFVEFVMGCVAAETKERALKKWCPGGSVPEEDMLSMLTNLECQAKFNIKKTKNATTLSPILEQVGVIDYWANHMTLCVGDRPHHGFEKLLLQFCGKGSMEELYAGFPKDKDGNFDFSTLFGKR